MNHLNDFLEHLRMIHRSNKTIYNYNYILRIAKSYFKEKDLEDDRLVNETHIIDYLKYLKDINIPDWIYLRIVLYLKKYFEYLNEINAVFVNPTLILENPKEFKRRIKPIPKEQILDCLNKINTGTDFGIRSKAIFELLYSTGIRPMELRRIKLNHINFNKKELFIEKGKMNKDRVVPVGDTALKWIQEYLAKVRPKYLKDKSVPYLFLTLVGACKELSCRGLHDVFRLTFKKYKIKKFKPYALRSSCATHCLINGMGILHIKEMLGHNRITTTQGYLHVEFLDLKKVFNEKHPRNKYK